MTPHVDRGLETMATFVGAENVERSRNYLEELDYAGFPSAWNALDTMSCR